MNIEFLNITTKIYDSKLFSKFDIMKNKKGLALNNLKRTTIRDGWIWKYWMWKRPN